MKFEIIKKAYKARLGKLVLRPGLEVPTPAFMPVASGGAAKAISMEDLNAIGYRLILGNVYHLLQRPGIEVIRRRGGLRGFSGWPHGWLTDSGGYQIFSLAKSRKVDSEGVTFQSALDGSTSRLTPESVIEAQEALGSEILMCLDVCPGSDAAREEISLAVRRTLDWASRSKNVWDQARGALFGILQGGRDPALREECAKGLRDLDLPGYALGGISVGEGVAEMRESIKLSSALLPQEKPRYLMGVGSPSEILFAVDQGVDLFDCVVPTRHARHGQAFTRSGVVRLRRQEHKDDDGALDEACTCTACRSHSRSYLRHLVMSDNPTGSLLLTRHNLTFFHDLMESCRRVLADGSRLSEVAQEFGIA